MCFTEAVFSLDSEDYMITIQCIFLLVLTLRLILLILGSIRDVVLG